MHSFELSFELSTQTGWRRRRGCSEFDGVVTNRLSESGNPARYDAFEFDA